MRIAVLADVHGNIDALEAVLGDLPSSDAVICLGDCVGYYDAPNEVCQRMRDIGATCIRGNHDAFAIGELPYDPRRDDHYKASWTRSQLSADNLGWLRSLPVELSFSWGGLELKVRHASPYDETTYVYPDCNELERLFSHVDDIMLLGHTHIPLRLEQDGKAVYNPGSVGQPRDYDPRASYGILDTHKRSFEFRRVRYNNEAMCHRLMKLGWPESTLAILSRTR